MYSKELFDEGQEILAKMQELVAKIDYLQELYPISTRVIEQQGLINSFYNKYVRLLSNLED